MSYHQFQIFEKIGTEEYTNVTFHCLLLENIIIVYNYTLQQTWLALQLFHKNVYNKQQYNKGGK